MQWRNLALAACILSITPIAWASAEDAPQTKLQSTLKSLQSSKEDAAALKEKLEAAQREAARLQEASTKLAADLQASEERASHEEVHYDRVSAQLAAKQQEFNARSADYAQTIRSLLRMQHIPATAIIASPDNIEQLLRTTSVLRYVNTALKERALQLKTEMATLKNLQEAAAASKQSLDKALTTLEARQKSLNAGIAERQKLQMALTKDHAAAVAKVEALSKQSQSLQELITKLEQSRDRMAIAESTSKQLPPSAARGNWRLPVAGSILHRFGERKNANESWRGLVMRARAGGAVVAPSAGEVVFTGPFRDYGRMVLLKHKDKHISLLAGMGNITVVLNQQVGRGEPLGSMGNTASPELYVELREESKPVDPAAWYANVAPE